MAANNHSPMFTNSKYESSVRENMTPNTFVTKVSATDEDWGSYGTATYHFVGNKASKYFRIEENTGEIYTVQTLDREETPFHQYTIMAMDIGGRTGFTTFAVDVQDTNDNNPRFVHKKYTALIPKNATRSDVVLKYFATDDDTDENAKIKYHFHESVSYTVKESFYIDENSGEMRLLVSPDQLGSELIEFFVEASDFGEKSLTTTVPVIIRIIEEPAPLFLSEFYTFSISEESEPGTVIGSVTARYDEKLKYSIDWNEEDVLPPIAIKGGDLILRSRLDAENGHKIYLTVTAHPIHSPQYTAFTTVLIEIQDANDQTPVFDSAEYYISIAENSPVGSSILKLTARDGDSGRNGEVHYAIEEKTPLEKEPTFVLDLHSGWLSLNKELDAQTKSNYQLTAIAQDSGSKPLKQQVKVVVQVIDYNDSPPIFSRDNYYASVSEDSMPGTVVLEVSATDADSPPTVNNKQFYIVDGNIGQKFHVRSGGQIYVSKQLDKEERGRYELKVVVTDGFFSSSANVFVEVLDVNDNPPLCTQPFYKQEISEDAIAGTELMQISVFDPDTSSRPQFYLSGLGSNSFTINLSSGQLNILKPLDREKQDRYLLRATVRDSGTNTWECSSYIQIDVTDINDNPPAFSQDAYSVNVPENSNDNLLIMKIQATDPDFGRNKKVTYSLETSSMFSIDRNTGIIAVHQSLDREDKAIYNLTVIAMDHGIVRHMAKTNVLVLVTDVNDNPPDFASHIYYTTVSESSPIGSEIIRVLATSRDTGKNAEITYSIIGGNENRKFGIHPTTGTIQIVNELDYERASSYLLTIQAKDHGEPPLSSHATVNVTVSDVNDNSPIFIQNWYSAIANEAFPIGERLVQVRASDQDSGEFGELTYAISGGNPYQEFHIDKYTGWISVAGPLDREKIASYSLEVIAIDKGVPSRSGVVSVSIDILDANDNPPVFVDVNSTAYVQEDKSPGHVVYKFEVTDEDSDKARNGAPFTFEIRGGNSQRYFSITQDGELLTASHFKREIKDFFRLHIRVYDNGQPPLHSDTWIDVKIIEESKFAPVIFPLQVTAFIRPESYIGGDIGKVYASDEDPFDILFYSISPSKRSFDYKYFDISKEGVISSKSSIDEGSYEFNVTVNDGKFKTSEKVEITFYEILDEMIDNAVLVQLQGVTPQEFLLTYKHSFHRAIKNILNVRSRDIIVISIDSLKHKDKRSRHSYYTYNNAKIEILFAVRKSKGYMSRKYIRRRLQNERKIFEVTLGLSVVNIPQSKCKKNSCKNGSCQETISLEQTVIKVSTDAMSFAAPKHRHESICICPSGFSGNQCEKVINKCAHNPCPSYKRCIPQQSDTGFICICPEGMIGSKCDMNKSECIGKENTPRCYTPVAPISFKGKGVVQYLLHKPIEIDFKFSVWFRTLHSSGNLMFASGTVDYSILEIYGGKIQFSWDLGTKEGRITINSRRVDDGLWHHVSVERQGNAALLLLDHSWSSKGFSPGNSELLNMDPPHLYLGGEMRKWLSDDPLRGFVGCLDSPLISGIRLPLTQSPTNAVATLLSLSRVTPHCFKELQSPGPCGKQPCLNGATCEERGSAYHCHCQPRFEGKYCEADTDPCASSPCLNNGKCVKDGTSYRCQCSSLVRGDRCQFIHCNPNPCLNDGICEEGPLGPLCKCDGFTGPYCNVDINECESQPCREGGTCINTYGGFKCMCPTNFTGVFCDVPAADFIFPIGLTEMIYIGVGICFVFILSLITCMVIYCRSRKSRRPEVHQNHVILNSKNHHENHHNTFKRNSKLSNIEVSQNCTLRTDTYPTPSEPLYIPLNNFDTIRSYGSAADDLEVSKDFMQNISKQNVSHSRNSSFASSLGVRTSPRRDEKWRGGLANNLKEAYYDIAKIPNDVKFNQSEYFNMKNLGNSDRKSTFSREDGSVRSGLSNDELQGYHWDCSDWVRQSQNPLPNILEIPGGEVRDSSSFHSNESNESISSKPHKHSNLTGRLPSTKESVGGESELDFSLGPPQVDLNASIMSAADSEVSVFSSQPERYEKHLNQYLPRHILNSESDDERGKLLRPAISTFTPHKTQKLPDLVEHSPPLDMRVRNRRGKVRDAEEYEEGLSLFAASIASDGEVCEIDDSEVNSEFETEK